MRKEGVALVVVLILLASSVSAVFTGTIEGYVRYMNGTFAGSAASVSATVGSCSGSGCTGSTSTDTNSYYVIANLNLPAGGAITASATKGAFSGSNATTANSFQAAAANITLCQAPSAPTLTVPPSNHDTNRTLFWTSGTDSNGFATYDVFQFNSGPVNSNATSPQIETGLSIGSSYSWTVKTCNTFNDFGCCSSTSSNTFSVGNTAPSAPTLTDQDNTDLTSVSLQWTSGTDSDGDNTTDTLQFSNTSDFSNIIDSSTSATSPRTENGLSNTSALYWRVRTCDSFGSCSSYASDIFFDYTCITSTGGGGGGGGGGGSGGSGCNPYFNQCQLGDVGCRGNSKMICGDWEHTGYLIFNFIPCEPGKSCINSACVDKCQEEWICDTWSKCSAEGIQTRACRDYHNCGAEEFKAPDQRTCVPGVGEAPLLIGVPPFTIAAPTVMTTPLVPIATVALGFLLGLLTLSLLFDRQFDVMVLSHQLGQEAKMITKGEYAKADVFNTKVVDSHIRRAVLDDRKAGHRAILKKYYEMNRDIARYHARLALKVGEKAKASVLAKRAEEFNQLVQKYSD